MCRLPLGHTERKRKRKRKRQHTATIQPPPSHLPPPPPPVTEPWLHAASGIAIGFACSKVVQWTELKQKVPPQTASFHLLPSSLSLPPPPQEHADNRADRALHEKSHL